MPKHYRVTMILSFTLELTYFACFLYPSQILFAMSPLLALGYVLYTGFDDPEEEKVKRSKKTDFQLEGHDE